MFSDYILGELLCQKSVIELPCEQRSELLRELYEKMSDLNILREDVETYGDE